MSYRWLPTCFLRASALLLLSAGTFGCIDAFETDVDAPAPRPLVVDGRVTSGPGPHEVTLTLASAFEQSIEGQTQQVDSARVSIIDETRGTRVRLDQTGPGVYTTDRGELVGTPKHTYRLEIALPDGRRYRSRPETMPEPVPLDSLYTDYVPTPVPKVKVYATADDPNRKNYYRWSTRVTREYPISSTTPPFYCWETSIRPPSQVPILDDQFIEGNRIDRKVVYALPPGPKLARMNQVDVRQYTLTRAAYDFWSKVREQVEGAGDPFSAAPTPIRGNVISVQDSSDRALGYFSAVGTSRQRTQCLRQGRNDDTPRPPDIDPSCLPERGVTFDRPPYWTCTPSENP